MSISAYVRDGQPLLAPHGTYVQIARITDNMQNTLAERLGAPVVLEHDGTAAATAHAGDTQTAVFTIGTALGIGFPAADAIRLRRVNAGFVIK
jgi:predicted NBD/HSP70 family sugar kinase